MARKILLIGGTSKLSLSLQNEYKKHYKFVTASRNNCDIDLDLSVDPLRYLHKSKKLEDVSHAIFYAGLVNIKYIEENKDEAFVINYQNQKIILDFLNGLGIKCILISSSSVFNSNIRCPIETEVRRPSSEYGRLKALLEDEFMDNKLNSIIRLTKVFFNDSILKSWLSNLRENNPIICYEDLRVAPITSECVNRSISSCINSDSQYCSHVTPSSDLSYFELAHKMASYFKYSNDLVLPRKAGRDVLYKPRTGHIGCRNVESRCYEQNLLLENIFGTLNYL